MLIASLNETIPSFLLFVPTYLKQFSFFVGNCWFVAGAVTLAASNWKLFKRVVPLDQEFDEQYAGKYVDIQFAFIAPYGKNVIDMRVFKYIIRYQ